MSENFDIVDAKDDLMVDAMLTPFLVKVRNKAGAEIEFDSDELYEIAAWAKANISAQSLGNG